MPVIKVSAKEMLGGSNVIFMSGPMVEAYKKWHARKKESEASVSQDGGGADDVAVSKKSGSESAD